MPLGGEDAAQPVAPAPVPRLLIDLTQSWAQPGPTPLGAAPIERRLARYLGERHGALVGFCAYDAGRGDFVAVSLGDAERLLDGRPIPRPPAVDQPAPPRGRLEPHFFGPARRLLLPLLLAAPAALQPPLAEFLVRGRVFAGAVAQVAAALFRRPASVAARSQPSVTDLVEFSDRDVLILSGRGWNQAGLFACLYRHRQASGLTPVIYCHDAFLLDHPHFASPAERSLLHQSSVDLAWCAARIICSSECARAALRRFIAAVGLPPRPLGVIPPGVDPPAAAPERPPEPLAGLRPGGFALFVGAIQASNNHQLLYDLWARLGEEMPDRLIPLVLAGAPGWLGDDIIGTIRDDHRMDGRLLVVLELTDEALAWLYRNCVFTLHPSFAEDWAQPVAESLAWGKYCVASTAPANAEAAQGLLDLLDPLDFVAWHREVGRLLADPGYLRAKEGRLATFRPPDWATAGDRLAAEIATCLAAGAPA